MMSSSKKPQPCVTTITHVKQDAKFVTHPKSGFDLGRPNPGKIFPRFLSLLGRAKKGLDARPTQRAKRIACPSDAGTADRAFCAQGERSRRALFGRPTQVQSTARVVGPAIESSVVSQRAALSCIAHSCARSFCSSRTSRITSVVVRGLARTTRKTTMDWRP